MNGIRAKLLAEAASKIQTTAPFLPPYRRAAIKPLTCERHRGETFSRIRQKQLKPVSSGYTKRCINRLHQVMHQPLTSGDASIAHLMRCIIAHIRRCVHRSHHAMHPSRKSCDASIAHIMRCINRSHHAMHPSLASCDASIAQIMRCIQTYRQIR